MNLEWCPPPHISVDDVKGFKEEFQLAEVTGVFDCFVKGDELSDELTSDSVWYEVEAELSEEAARFFSFKQNEPGRFKFPAESLWAIPAGVPLATAYELYYVATNGEWGHSMSVADRVQGINAVVLSEVRKVTSQGMEVINHNHLILPELSALHPNPHPQCRNQAPAHVPSPPDPVQLALDLCQHN